MPSTLNSVAEVLKATTADRHLDAEKTLLPKLSAIASAKDYATILYAFYGFFHPLQKIIFSYITREDLPDVEERRHASVILQDLDSLGFSSNNILECKQLPAIQSKAQAFGALYVLEGSTLGGRMIRKMLLKNEAIGLSEKELNFFDGYGERTGSKWKAFVEVLNQQKETEEIIAAANTTFLSFQNWLQQSLYASDHQ